jgi:hypothetical protein
LAKDRSKVSRVFEVGDVELHLSVEVADCVIEEVAVLGTVGAQLGEDLAEQACHQIDNLSLHVVHARGVGEVDPVVLHRSLLESLEGVQYVDAVIGLRVVLP